MDEAELFEKTEDMDEFLKNMRRTRAEEWRMSEAARSDVTWKAASSAQAPEQESVLLTGLGLTSTVKTRWVTKVPFAALEPRRRGERKESAETQDYVSCQDTEVDNDKSLEGLVFGSAHDQPLQGTVMFAGRQKVANQKGPMQSGKTSMIRQKTSRRRLLAAFGSDRFLPPMSEQFTTKEEVGKASAGGSTRQQCSWKQTAAGKMSHHNRRSLNSCE